MYVPRSPRVSLSHRRLSFVRNPLCLPHSLSQHLVIRNHTAKHGLPLSAACVVIRLLVKGFCQSSFTTLALPPQASRFPREEWGPQGTASCFQGVEILGALLDVLGPQGTIATVYNYCSMGEASGWSEHRFVTVERRHPTLHHVSLGQRLTLS